MYFNILIFLGHIGSRLASRWGSLGSAGLIPSKFQVMAAFENHAPPEGSFDRPSRLHLKHQWS